MEKQAAAVKTFVKEVVQQMNSEDLDRSVKQLTRQEQRHRARIEKLYKSNRVSEVHLIEYSHAIVSLVCSPCVHMNVVPRSTTNTNSGTENQL